MIELLLLAIGTLLPIANPLSTAFVFNSLAGDFPKKKRQEIALRASLTAVLVLLIFMFLGNWLLTFFGITVYAFRVAGGLYLGFIGFEMLSSDLRKQPDDYSNPNADISIIPLAIPLISGPGSMTAVLVLSQDGSWTTYFVVAMAILILGFLAWIMLREAHYLTKIIGRTGTKALEKILGLIVLVIAVQFLFNGISGYLEAIGIGLF